MFLPSLACWRQVVALTPSLLFLVRGAFTSSLSADLLSITTTLASGSDRHGPSSLASIIKTNSARIDQISATFLSSRQRVPVSVTCEISKLVFSGKYVDSESSQYLQAVQEPWSETCWLQPACFLSLNTTVDVAVALRIISNLGSKFAVRSGAHNPNSGFASIDNSGVLIDLGNLNSIELAPTNDTVGVGTGAHWGDVYARLDPYNISAIGGRNPPVGVGGLLLGGGMPYIPSLYGLACDNVKNFELVLANSTVVNANARSNPDLFFALKGGGPNYGIVTRFDLYTRPLHQVWYKFDLYNMSDYREVLTATVQTQHAMESDNKAGFVFNANSGVILVGFIYGQWTSRPAVFRFFDSILPIGTFAEEANGTVLTLSDALNIGGNTSAKREPVTVSHLVDLDLYLEAFDQYLNLFQYSKDPAALMSFGIQPISEATVAAGNANGGNPLGLVPMEQNWFNSLADWSLSSDDALAHGAVNNMKFSLQSIARTKNKLLPFQFQNDASYTQNPLASYGTGNLAELKATSHKYDPDQVFQKLQNSGFLLQRA